MCAAGAMAMANMPQAYIPGKSMVSAGVAGFDGQAALALGVSGALRVVVRDPHLVAAERAPSPDEVTLGGHSPMLVDRRADKGSHQGKRCPMVGHGQASDREWDFSHGLAELG